MKRVIGFLMCLPMLALLSGSVWWAVTTDIGHKIFVVLASTIVCLVIGTAGILLIMLCYSLLARGSKMLFNKRTGDQDGRA
jgi:predicted membrane protein